MGSTVETLSGFGGGNRMLGVPGVESACTTIDALNCPDLNTLLLCVASQRAERIGRDDVLKGTSFHAPSEVSPRDMHYIQGLIYDVMSTATFVELSPLQPLGTNAYLAGTNQKNVVTSLRQSEVNADITTALFRNAITQRTPSAAAGPVQVAANTRITRSQTFDPKTGFLPHFGMFGQVTVGRQEKFFDPEELEALAAHLETEVAILDRVAADERSNVASIDIKVGNILFMDDLAAQGLIDMTEVRKRTIDPNYNAFESAGLDIPSSLPLDTPNLAEELKRLGFTKGVSVTERFQQVLAERNPALLSRITLDLSRIAGVGYYKNLCYKIDLTNNQDVRLPLVDGGTTNWAEVCGYGKKAYTVTSGIGTELLCKHFLKHE